MAVAIPNNLDHSVSFDYEGVEYFMSQPRWNECSLSYVTDLRWNGDAVLGMLVAGGVDMLENIPKCPLPSLWAYNANNYKEDTNLTSISDLSFVIR